MTALKQSDVRRRGTGKAVLAVVFGLAVVGLTVPALRAQSASQAPSQPPSNAQPAQNLPDAPSAVQPPPPKPIFPDVPPSAAPRPQPVPNDTSQTEETPTPPPMPPIETLPPGTGPRNQINPGEDLYKISVSTNFVQVPVMVKDSRGWRVDGLLPRDFTVLENGKKQTLKFFSSDPLELSVAIVLDIGMPDVAVQKVEQTYSALVGALSPYDEAAIYTYSSTVSQLTDFTRRAEKLTAVLNELKQVRGRNNGPAVLSGPMSGGPTVNGAPVGGPTIAPVNTPPREAHVLNDAILRAAVDLSKRERTRRKVIFVVSDGRELGSRASYRDVLRVLETHDIQVKAVVLDSYSVLLREAEKIHLPGQGYSDILPKYVSASGGGQVITVPKHAPANLTGEIVTEVARGARIRNEIENAYAAITSEARNQYTLGYAPQAITGSSAYRDINVLVDRKGLKVYAKDGYYPTPSAR